MGGRGSGRRPKPTEQKRRLGNPGHRPLPAQAGELIVGVFGRDQQEPGRSLGRFGRALWDQIWLGGAAWLKPSIDSELVLMACEMADERVILRAAVLQTPEDWRKRRALRELDKQLASLLGQLGFSPTDRTTIGVGEIREHGFSELHKRIAAKRMGS
jgi:hypothetical protein